MRFNAFATAAVLAAGRVVAYTSEEEKPLRPCTVRSQVTGSFFDLNAVTILPPENPEETDPEEWPQSWHARGYDYPSNFSINICHGVVEKIDEFADIDSELTKNVSAFYTIDGTHYALGIQRDELVLRGRKLVLNYTDGSYCDGDPEEKMRSRRAALPKENDNDHKGNPLLAEDYNYDPYPKDAIDTVAINSDPAVTGFSSLDTTHRRKSMIISLLCQADKLATSSISFVGTADHCSYFFEMRTTAACSVVETEEQSVGPAGVFGLIFLVAFGVYVVGGCFYQRTVMHQRGWRQMPNYSMWAGMVSFVVDIFIILTSSCMRLLPGRRGYSRVSTIPNGRTRGIAEDENRLIDQLDEEWDD